MVGSAAMHGSMSVRAAARRSARPIRAGGDEVAAAVDLGGAEAGGEDEQRQLPQQQGVRVHRSGDVRQRSAGADNEISHPSSVGTAPSRSPAFALKTPDTPRASKTGVMGMLWGAMIR
ncbi:hypothetical protein [Nocardia thailandica]|uniref:hypothetical protein n=1 Tax=Nocardia thailandica TaxID=257275 RepID=UPI0003079745|nr:hypothetical protein [Nocardia thailandica]